MSIDLEIEGYEFYMYCSEHYPDEKTRTIFLQLAKEELQHKETLMELLEENRSINSSVSFDFDIKELKPFNKSTDMDFKESIELAIIAEEEAIQLYEGFAVAAASEEERKIFIELAKMETKHKKQLELLLK